MEIEIRNILLWLKGLKTEIEKKNIKNDKIKFNLDMIIERIGFLVENEINDNKYKLKELEKAKELLEIVKN